MLTSKTRISLAIYCRNIGVSGYRADRNFADPRSPIRVRASRVVTSHVSDVASAGDIDLKLVT